MFEDLLMRKNRIPVKEESSRWTLFRRKREEDMTDEEYIQREVRLWRPNELPLKSVIHMINKLGIGVEVYTYMDPMFVPAIEHWLARKGADVQVFAYYDVDELYEDFKYNRDVHTFFTTSEEDAKRLGIRSTVVKSDGTFGI
jgi:hypothetical protein